MHRRYAEISHFRAPFKNWPSISGYGAADDSAAAAAITTDKDGLRSFKPQIADVLLAMLNAYSIIHISNDDVKIDPIVPGDIRETAASWLKRKVADGKIVLAGTSAGAHMFGVPVANVDKVLVAVKGRQAAIEKTVGLTPMLAVLAKPAGIGALVAGMGPVGIAVGALVVVGGVALLAKKRRRSAVPNRRRRHRRGRR